MNYDLVLYQSAKDDLDDAFMYLVGHAPKTVGGWFDRLQDSILTQKVLPTFIHTLRKRERQNGRCGG